MKAHTNRLTTPTSAKNEPTPIPIIMPSPGPSSDGVLVSVAVAVAVGKTVVVGVADELAIAVFVGCATMLYCAAGTFPLPRAAFAPSRYALSVVPFMLINVNRFE